jgi:hypothetical protein
MNHIHRRRRIRRLSIALDRDIAIEPEMAPLRAQCDQQRAELILWMRGVDAAHLTATATRASVLAWMARCGATAH